VPFELDMAKSAYKFSQKDVYCDECAAKVKDWRFIRMKNKV
jgi:hypothetical protein